MAKEPPDPAGNSEDERKSSVPADETPDSNADRDSGYGEQPYQEPQDFVLSPDNPYLCLLAAAPKSQHEIVTRLMHGQRFIHLNKNKFGFWKKRKCHLILTADLKFIVYSAIKGESTGGKDYISTDRIMNVTCSGMFGVNNPPAEFKDLKTFSIIIRNESKKRADPTSKRPKSTVMHLTPDINCVQIGEIVEFTEIQNGEDVSKEGEVIQYFLENPSVVHVRVADTGEVISVVGETLNRATDENLNLSAQEGASKTVWDWYNGLVKIKALVAQHQTHELGFAEYDNKHEDEERTFAKGSTRKAWHKKVLTHGIVFNRAFVGAKWKEAKIISNCYVRCSEDMSELLYAPVQSLISGDDKTKRLFLAKNEFKSDAELRAKASSRSELNRNWSTSKFNTDPFTPNRRAKTFSRSELNRNWSNSKFNTDPFTPNRAATINFSNTPMSTPERIDNSSKVSYPQYRDSPQRAATVSPAKATESPTTPQLPIEKKGTSETMLLFQQSKEMYHENKIRQMLEKSNNKNRSSKKRSSSTAHSMSLKKRDGGFFLKGVKSKKIRTLQVKDLAEILTDSKCPAFSGCNFSIGLRFACPKRDVVISFECRTRKELDRWHRQFRYLKEIRGGVTMPINVRAGFRMKGDLKWQGSFEEHFEFYCPSFHKMNLDSGTHCQQFRCKNCHLKGNRDTVFFHVCPVPKCGYSMCTKCAKTTSKIGEGGFSEVHLAINKNMVDKPPCVIKIFKGMMGHSSVEKMVMETEVLFKLQAHPNIVKYQGYGGPNENGQLWMVMEYCDGGSVLDLRRGMKTLMAESHIAYIIHCVLRALAFLHSKGIAHKDIKAANILLTTHGFVKLSDFGISEKVRRNAEVKEFAGSPLWMPPEAYRKERVDEKGDIWSLGITAIELAEGKPPHYGMQFEKVAEAVMSGQPIMLRNKSSLDKVPRKDDAPEWSDQFKDFLARCFYSDPKKRPSADDLLQDPFMDEEQFKLTTFCKRLMNVMEDAGIFEMSSATNCVGENIVQKNVPALICRKSLLYLIQHKNYKEINQKDDVETKSENKGGAKEPPVASIRNRLYGKGSHSSNDDDDLDKAAPQKNDLTRWQFFETLQQELDPRRKSESKKGPMTESQSSDSSAKGAPLLIVEDDLTKTREVAVAPMLNLGSDDLTITREGAPASSKADSDGQTRIAPMLNLDGEDLTKTREVKIHIRRRTGGASQVTSPLPPVAEDNTDLPDEAQQIRLNESIVTKRQTIGFPKGAAERFIKNSDQTFRLGSDGNDRIFSTHNFAIDTSGRMDSRETRMNERIGAMKLEYKRQELIHIRHLGRGASGYVVKSFHLPSREFVALKHMSIENAKLRHQLDKELTAFVKIQHPQVLKLNGAYLEGQRIVIVLEYMDVGSLEDVIRRRRDMPEHLIAQMAKQALEGIHHIHSKRFVHRDVKPENFLVSSRGELKVADFGLMTQLRKDETGVTDVIGTLAYMSPERHNHQEFSFPADIWAIGISLIFCATGKHPFPNPKDYWQLITAITKGQAPTLDKKAFSAEFCDFIDLCVSKEPSERWTAEQLLQHPFISNAASKEELAAYLLSGEEKSLVHRAKQELKLLACEIYHNRNHNGSEMFINQKEIGKLASQFRVTTSFIAELARQVWKDASKFDFPAGRTSFEFWKSETRQ